MASKYIHGYQEVEQERLVEQAKVIENQIFDFIDFSQVNRLLEIGSGVGAQTEILLKRFPHLSITGVEYESKQIEKAYKNLEKHGFDTDKVEFIHQDATQLSLEKEFDGAFICWVLEHVQNPQAILTSMKPCLRDGAMVVVTEVFNSTFYTYPERKEIQDYWKIYNDYQISIGGDPEVGAKLGSMLSDAGYKGIQLRSGGFHLDKREADQKRKVFSYWKNLMSSGAPNLMEENLITEKEVIAMQQAMDELREQEDSIFFYRFIQATAFK
ncbi:methyltransferase domain-containing protein [Litoribacter ruber]|uniref:class I SAM-dependent methyltransferase n=1 Tax=Litoribacter ruber TaxID=702568 RepID=UPI001BDB58D9|nr:class I SAM-dependent methyltransferase [Litoribacter ruber]MBT0809815.1 methyltransferase domain-containing protein [Litoribacter ruber]